MKTVQNTAYVCDICGHTYEEREEALSCESRAVSHDRGVKVGDIVYITGGDGTGQKLKVTNTGIFDKYWGHHAWERYWHTVWVSGDIIDSWGSRLLTFDDYEVINK